MITSRNLVPRDRVAQVGILLLLILVAGCSPRREPLQSERTTNRGRLSALRLSVDVFADTGRGGRIAVPAHRGVLVWLARVTPSRMPLPSPALPEMRPESLPPIEDLPPALEVDPGLKPPLLRVPGLLALPSGWGDRRGTVELDVRVDESGRVSDAAWAGGSMDTALVAAARRCALGMRFYPALRAGHPVSVWCRQRFDFGGARP
jgi:TonB family protein